MEAPALPPSPSDDERHFNLLSAVDDRLVPVGQGDTLHHNRVDWLGGGILFQPQYGRIHRVRWVKWTLAVVGGSWLGGISFWAVGFIDQIKTDIYQAQHHYRLDKAAVLAGIEIPKGSWVSIDEEGLASAIETAVGAVVSIDGALWRGDIRLISPCDR
jgi:hypothetical protein